MDPTIAIYLSSTTTKNHSQQHTTQPACVERVALLALITLTCFVMGSVVACGQRSDIKKKREMDIHVHHPAVGKAAWGVSCRKRNPMVYVSYTTFFYTLAISRRLLSSSGSDMAFISPPPPPSSSSARARRSQLATCILMIPRMSFTLLMQSIQRAPETSTCDWF